MNSYSPEEPATGRLIVTDKLAIPLGEFRFTFVRSQGPGGQNVNKVNSKAVLRWRIADTEALPEDVLNRFRQSFATRINQDGELILTSQRYRDQKRNRQDCLDKLRRLVLEVAKPPSRRRVTRPTAASRRRRRKNKELNSQKKQLRKNPRQFDD